MVDQIGYHRLLITASYVELDGETTFTFEKTFYIIIERQPFFF